jgi:hypothetical protein
VTHAWLVRSLSPLDKLNVNHVLQDSSRTSVDRHNATHVHLDQYSLYQLLLLVCSVTLVDMSLVKDSLIVLPALLELLLISMERSPARTVLKDTSDQLVEVLYVMHAIQELMLLHLRLPSAYSVLQEHSQTQPH